jgi:hypothetical protein
MKKIFDFFVAVLAPFIIIVAYSYCYHLLEMYKNTADDLEPLIFIVLLVNALAGTGMFFICKHAVSRQYSKRIPFEYLLGLLLMIYTNLYFFFPQPFRFILFSYADRLSGLFIGLYVCLFIYLMRRRAKMAKLQNM